MWILCSNLSMTCKLNVAVFGQVKRKQTTSGILLGDDVLTLMVEPNMDHSLIMGLVLVNGLMNRSM